MKRHAHHRAILDESNIAFDDLAAATAAIPPFLTTLQFAFLIRFFLILLMESDKRPAIDTTREVDGFDSVAA